MANNPIPQPSRDVPRAVNMVLAPMRDVLQRFFFSNSTERVVTRADLVKLGIASQEQVDQLEN